jgi:hypothetical protein
MTRRGGIQKTEVRILEVELLRKWCAVSLKASFKPIYPKRTGTILEF